MSTITDLITNIQNPASVQTYVLKNVEVKKTGRKATKMIGAKTFTLVEVVPYDSAMPQVADWVQESELFIVE